MTLMNPLESACLAIYTAWLRYRTHDEALAEVSNFVARYRHVALRGRIIDFAADSRCIKSAAER